MVKNKLFFIILFFSLVNLVQASYTIEGSFLFEDRVQDHTGFTGEIDIKPIRGADVQVLDISNSPSIVILSTGFTNPDGSFRINVTEDQIRNISIQVVTSSQNHPELFEQKVITKSGILYSLASPDYINHDPNTNINFTDNPIIASKEGAGGPFHIFDNAEIAENYVQEFTSELPRYPMVVKWDDGKRNGKVFYSSGLIYLMGDIGGDDDRYDDSVIWHEMGHYIVSMFSRSDSPGGTHVSSGLYDIRLTWGEGLGTFFMGAIRNYINDTNLMLYIETNGETLRWYTGVNSENRDIAANYGNGPPTPSAANELAVANALFDIVDDINSPDGSIGVDDDGIGLPNRQGDELIWDVLIDLNNSYQTFEKKVSMEIFWDRWLHLGKPYVDELRNIFEQVGIKYRDDDYEEDNRKRGRIKKKFHQIFQRL